MINWNEPVEASDGQKLRFLTKRKVEEGDPNKCSIFCLLTKEDGLEYVYCCGDDGQTSNSNIYGYVVNVPKILINWNKPIETESGIPCIYIGCAEHPSGYSVFIVKFKSKINNTNATNTNKYSFEVNEYGHPFQEPAPRIRNKAEP